MLVWQTLVATPVIRRLRRQFSRPARVRSSTWPAAALVADRGVPLDADQRTGIPDAAQFARDFIGDQLPVGEDLKIAVRVCLQNPEQFRMEERFAPEDAEIAVAVPLRIVEHPVHVVERDELPRRLHVHPAPLAAELAAIDDQR